MTDPTTMTPEETTRFLAVEVMGYFPSESLKGHWIVPQGGCILFDPLTIAGDRDMLVEAMDKAGFESHQTRGTGLREKDCYTIIRQKHGGPWYEASADTPGDALCLAAVKAIQAMKEKENGN